MHNPKYDEGITLEFPKSENKLKKEYFELGRASISKFNSEIMEYLDGIVKQYNGEKKFVNSDEGFEFDLRYNGKIIGKYISDGRGSYLCASVLISRNVHKELKNRLEEIIIDCGGTINKPETDGEYGEPICPQENKPYKDPLQD